MRIIPFPTPDDAAGEPGAPGIEQLEADVRALAPPMDPAFQERLRAHLAERAAGGEGGVSAPARRGRLRARLSGTPRRRGALGLAGALAVLIPAVLIAGGSGGPSHSSQSDAAFEPLSRVKVPNGEVISPHKAERAGNAPTIVPGKASEESSAKDAPAVEPAEELAEHSSTTSAGSAASTVAPAAPTPATSAPSSGSRLQQLGASMTLTATPSGVQQLADQVSQIIVGDGGFVAHSQVQQQSNGPSEAQLSLDLPSTKLAAALAALGRLAPVQSQSQALQDITSSYDAARTRLSDALAERRAALRALARAQTQGEIESLQARLSELRGTISRTSGEVKAVAHKAANAEVEVTVIGSRSAQDTGGALHRGLHDAGRVLDAVLIALLIGAGALAPVTLALLAAFGLRRALLRRRREQALSRA
jgi:hypothetical protein